MPGWKLIIHGGAKEIAPEQEADNSLGLAAAIAEGRAVLDAGGSAVRAVEASVRVLESLPVFNAGRGSEPTVHGNIEMCAAIMDGETLDVGGVMAIQEVLHPVSVARALLREREILLAGPAAGRFAGSIEAELCGVADLRTTDPAEAYEAAHDTVGAVAMDADGHFAAATSTGGLAGQMQGRIGDSPMPGCGYYAENGVGAVALSGHGEGLARLRMASRIMERLNGGDPDMVVADCLSLMSRVGGDGGGIVIDAAGRFGWHHNSPHFAVAQIAQGDTKASLWLKKPR